MGLGGFFKGLGKVALKAAPFAAMAIPGIGPIAGATIAAGSSAADKKVSGGSWKDALLSGGMSAGLSALGGGLGPSKNFVKEGVNAVDDKIASRGLGGMISNIAKSMGRGVLSNPSVMMDGPGTGGRAVSGSPSAGGNIPPYGGRMSGIGPSVLMQRDQNFPNLAEALNAGRQEAINDQPWRMGYDTISYGPTEEQRKNLGPEIRTRTPPIGPRY